VLVFTYRYFLHRFPELCILAVPRTSRVPIGCVVGKIDQEEIMASAAGGGACSPLMNNNGSDEDVHGNGNNHSNTNQNTETMAKVPTGYIGMLAVQSKYRRKGIGKALVRQVLQRMKDMGCTSVTLETEVKNLTAQRLYQDCFGFVREELLVRYYLNWGDAYRLRLWF
jgi:N-alpha-acetyltransferase 30